MKLRLLVPLLASLLAFSASAATISGTVTQAGSATPLRVTVAAYDPASGVLQGAADTDSKGKYSLTLPGGTYRLLAFDRLGVYATSFFQGASSFEATPVISLSENSAVAGVNFSLEVGATVSGRVSGVSGSPLAGIVVAAYNLDGSKRGFTSTDASGSYSLVLPPGSFKLAAFDENGMFSTRFLQNQTLFSLSPVLTVASGQKVPLTDFVLPALARISGAVVDATSGRPLNQITVSAYDVSGSLIATTTTNASGGFDLSVPAGAVKIVAADSTGLYAPGFPGHAGSFDSSREILVGPGESRSGLVVALSIGARLTGRVTDSAGRALPNITVVAYNRDGTTRGFTSTDGFGAYSILVPPGEYRVAAFERGLVYAAQFYRGQLTFASATRTTVTERQFVTGLDFSLSPGTRVSGDVYDSETGQPVFGAIVGAYLPSGDLVASAVTTTSGQWLLALAPGIYKFIAFDPGLRYANSYYINASSFESATELFVGSAPVDSVRFPLKGAGRIVGSVAGGRGDSSLSGIVITARDASGAVAGATVTDSEGRFQLAVRPGIYRLVVTDPEGRFATTYYLDASGLASATPLTVSLGQTTLPSSIGLRPLRARPRTAARR